MTFNLQNADSRLHLHKFSNIHNLIDINVCVAQEMSESMTSELSDVYLARGPRRHKNDGRHLFDIKNEILEMITSSVLSSYKRYNGSIDCSVRSPLAPYIGASMSGLVIRQWLLY